MNSLYTARPALKNLAKYILIALTVVFSLAMVSPAFAAGERDVPVVVEMLDGTDETVIFSGVPDHVDIHICQEIPGALICLVTEGGVTGTILIPIVQEEV